MIHRIQAGIAGVAMLLMPLAAGAQSQTDIQNQIQNLLNQVNQLQTQIQGAGNTTSSTTAGACLQITRTLRVGSTGEDVRQLQTYLAKDTNIYPEGLVTGYFGLLTEVAVKRYQAKVGIVSSGTADTTGYGVVGPKTRSILSQCGSGNSTTGGSTSGDVLGGFMRVEPVSGSAPLVVGVEVVMNTTRSCIPATYTVDFGDNSADGIFATGGGSCAEVRQTIGHTYTIPGIYTITLSAGAHKSQVSVVVGGTSNNSSTVNPSSTANLAVTAPTGGQVVQQGGPLSISWQTSNAPQGAGVRLELIDASTGNVVYENGGIISDVAVTGTYTWTVPLPNTPCAVDAGKVCGSGITAGKNYRVRAKLYTPLGACFGFCAPTSNFVIHKIADSSTFVINGANNGGGGFSIIPSATSLRTIAAQFDLAYSCAAYDIDWGDGSQKSTQTEGACAATPVVKSVNHTYATGGTYTIILKRGASLSSVDSATLSISN